jgi:hypothetical protein
MKMITVPSQASEINELLQQARHEDVLVRAADGTQFMLTAVDDFDEEIARTRRSTKLMALLDERANQTETIPLDDLKRQLGLSS